MIDSGFFMGMKFALAATALLRKEIRGMRMKCMIDDCSYAF